MTNSKEPRELNEDDLGKVTGGNFEIQKEVDALANHEIQNMPDLGVQRLGNHEIQNKVKTGAASKPRNGGANILAASKSV